MKTDSILAALLALCISSTTLNGQTLLSIPDGVATLGDNVQIPILLDLDEDDDVLGINLKVEFDPSEFTYVGNVTSESISDSLTAVINQQDSLLLISLAGIHPLSKSGTLIFLEFTPLQLGTTETSLSEYKINENDTVFPEVKALYKVFDVGGNKSPIAVQIPDTLTFFSGDTLQVEVDENLFIDPEDTFEDLTVTFSIDPVVVTSVFDTVTNVLAITTLDYSGFATLRVRVEDLDGGILEFDVILDIQVGVSTQEFNSNPLEFVLYQNYPNPFNPSTTITYKVPLSGQVLLEVYSMSGQKITTLVNGIKTAGSHTVRFNASALSSGIYLYRITSHGFSTSRKMMLVK